MKSIIPTIAAIAFILLFTRLGFWQLDRAEEKQGLYGAFDAAEGADPAQIGAIDQLDEILRYQPVDMRGRFDAEHTFFLDNQTVDGRPGLHVLTPFDLADGTVIVNRGWVPLQDRQQLPRVDAPAGDVVIRGAVTPPPQPGFRLGDTRWPTMDWPKLVAYLSLDQVSEAIGRPVADQLVLMSPQTDGGFRREWRPQVMTPDRHRGYAVQWFALGVAVAVVWISLTIRALRR